MGKARGLYVAPGGFSLWAWRLRLHCSRYWPTYGWRRFVPVFGGGWSQRRESLSVGIVVNRWAAYITYTSRQMVFGSDGFWTQRSRIPINR